MAKNNNLTDFLTDVANTIRAKKGTSEPLDPQDFSDEIATISTSKPEGPANVTPTTSAQTIYPSEGEAFNVVNVSAVTSTIDDNIRASNIKAGVSILGVSGTLQSAVLQSLNDTIDRSTPKTFYPDPGYDGFSVATIGVNLSSSSITPTSSLQTITPGSGFAGFGQVTVLGVTSAIDSNIQASNIKNGISILGVSGTLTAATLYSSSVTLNYSTQTFTPTSGYDGFSKITITAPLEERTFTPSTAFKTYTSPSTLGFGIVSINAVTSAIDSNIQANNIKSGITILGVAGTVKEGSDLPISNARTKIYQTFTETWTQISSLNKVLYSNQYVWTDGNHIYAYSNDTYYVLDRINQGWNSVTFNDTPSGFSPTYIWFDGTDVFYSNGSTQRVLDKSTRTWKSTTLNSGIYGSGIWTDGTSIYYSETNTQKVRNSNGTWSNKSWSGLTNFEGQKVWTDGTTIYYSDSTTQYSLNKSTSTWSAKTWSGVTPQGGDLIWTDGTNVYYDFNGGSEGEKHYKLNNGTWQSHSWTGVTPSSDIVGSKIWTDGANIYLTSYNTTYQLNKSTKITTVRCR